MLLLPVDGGRKNESGIFLMLQGTCSGRFASGLSELSKSACSSISESMSTRTTCFSSWLRAISHTLTHTRVHIHRRRGASNWACARVDLSRRRRASRYTFVSPRLTRARSVLHRYTLNNSTNRKSLYAPHTRQSGPSATSGDAI